MKVKELLPCFLKNKNKSYIVNFIFEKNFLESAKEIKLFEKKE